MERRVKHQVPNMILTLRASFLATLLVIFAESLCLLLVFGYTKPSHNKIKYQECYENAKVRAVEAFTFIMFYLPFFTFQVSF